MITMIYGGSGSGKSAYAEDTLCSLFPGREKIDLATMEPAGEEGRKKVQRHRMLRAGKGFVTMECPRDVDRLADECRGKILLLECLSNLVANEMFVPGRDGAWRAKKSDEVVAKVLRELEVLGKASEHLFLVGNNVFEDGIAYDSSTTEYLRAMGKIHESMASRVDCLVEVVVGIPLVLKGKIWA